MTETIRTTIYTTEASESNAKSASEIAVPDPSPEIAIAAIKKNEIPVVAPA